jgi:phage shock protein PspC (stress-responsive transcriptional regulator)
MAAGRARRQPGDMSEHTLNPPSIKRLERTQSGKILAGVSGGLGRYFDLTPTVFRLGFVVLTLLGGAGVLVYIAAALIIPKEGEERSIAEDILANRSDHPGRLVALGLLAVAILSLLARADTWPTAGSAWALVAIAGLIFLWTRKGRGTRGLLIGALTAIALLLVTAIAAISASFAWFDVSLNDGVGDRTYAPTSVQSLPQRYELGIGTLEVDLAGLAPSSATSVKAHVGIGGLRVVVPQDAQVAVDARVKLGEVDALGHHDDGTDIHVTTPGGGTITVDASVGAGHIDVVRAS